MRRSDRGHVCRRARQKQKRRPREADALVPSDAHKTEADALVPSDAHKTEAGAHAAVAA